MNQTVTINARKFDSSIHRSWTGELLGNDGDLLTFKGVFENEVDHPQLGIIRRGTISYEFYWLDRWFNVFRFHEPNGRLRNWYCNVNLPPKFESGVLDYVDLDLDLLVWRDFRIELLDRDDFESNCDRYGYSDDVKRGAESALLHLCEVIKRREFPFDFED
jgi:protein associated with RNAse G/E